MCVQGPVCMSLFEWRCEVYSGRLSVFECVVGIVYQAVKSSNELTKQPWGCHYLDFSLNMHTNKVWTIKTMTDSIALQWVPKWIAK